MYHLNHNSVADAVKTAMKVKQMRVDASRFLDKKRGSDEKKSSNPGKRYKSDLGYSSASSGRSCFQDQIMRVGNRGRKFVLGTVNRGISKGIVHFQIKSNDRINILILKPKVKARVRWYCSILFIQSGSWSVSRWATWGRKHVY